MGDRHECPHVIPLARSELTDLLCADPGLSGEEREAFRRLCEMVTAAFHLEYTRRLMELKSAYLPFDPDADTLSRVRLPEAERQRRLNGLLRDFAWLLGQAHFKHLTMEELAPALRSASDWGIRMDVDFSAFEHVAFFVRGEGYQTRTRRRWQNFYREEEVEAEVYRRLVLILKLRRHPRLGPKVDTEHVYIKMFKDIPKLDVDMLLPGAQVHLRLLDRGKITGGFLGGVGVMVYNFFAELVRALHEFLLSPNAMWGIAAGSVGYGYKTWYNYHQTRQAYHLLLTESLYFQNLDGNAGVLTRLLDEAEEQDCRAAILGYFCLWRYARGEGWTGEELDASMGVYLDRYADVGLVCPPGEGLARLRRLGLVEGSGERYRAVPPERAAGVLRGAWDRYFPPGA